MTHSIKRVLSELFSISGIHSVLERLQLSRNAMVLMYHRVLPSRTSAPCFVQPGMYVSSETFERHVAYLTAHFRVVFLEELMERMLAGKEIGRLCAITFDDGWRDNYTYAFPILARYGVPATVFLATGFVGTDRMFWPEELCHHLDGLGGPQQLKSEGTPAAFMRFSETMGLFDGQPREDYLDAGISILKKFTPEERQHVLDHLAGMHNDDPVDRQMMDWDEIRIMFASNLVRFGAHTVNHEMLDQIPLPTAAREISDSKIDIEQRLGCRVRSFAYPNGNHSNAIRHLLREQGFLGAVTTGRGYVKPGAQLLEIPRIGMHDDVSGNLPQFRSRMLMPFF